MLVVQSGADAHFDDPLADLLLTTHDYEAIFRRVLFTLGGGYSFRATPRVWTLLFLLVNDYPVEHQLPSWWLDKWNGPAGGGLPATLHDPESERVHIPRRAEIAHRNRQVAERLLDQASQYWF